MVDQMVYEDIPQLFNGKKERVQMRSKSTTKQSMAITDMSTAKIVWHLVKKHKFFLSLLYSACITMAYLSQYSR